MCVCLREMGVFVVCVWRVREIGVFVVCVCGRGMYVGRGGVPACVSGASRSSVHKPPSKPKVLLRVYETFKAKTYCL